MLLQTVYYLSHIIKYEMDEYLTPIHHIQLICDHLQIKLDQITNVYNYGSQVHGLPTETSDYDILIVGDFDHAPLKFKNPDPDNPYFYDFKVELLNICNRLYSVLVHSNANFEKLLQINFLVCVEALFMDRKYQPISKIDYKAQYLEKWYSKDQIKNSLRNEIHYSKMNRKNFKRGTLYGILDGKWVLKKFFNVLRYHHSISELIFTKKITDFGQKWNSYKVAMLERYEKEGDSCVNEIFEDINLKIKGEYLEKLKN